MCLFVCFFSSSTSERTVMETALKRNELIPLVPTQNCVWELKSGSATSLQ